MVYEKLKENNYEMIKNCFFDAEAGLKKTKFDVNFSGSTAVMVILIDDKIICANAGDSRAILVKENLSNNLLNKESINRDKMEAIALSKDHKPELQAEKARIVSSGGRVDKYSENGIKTGPYRVWLKNEEYPGLAMSRSLGDLVAGSIGVICEPGIIY